MSKQHEADLDFAAAVMRDGERRAAAYVGRLGEMPPPVPPSPKTPAEQTAAQRLQADRATIASLADQMGSLAERMTQAKREQFVQYLAAVVEVMSQQRWP